jgi:FixJ family two-component response regulator
VLAVFVRTFRLSKPPVIAIVDDDEAVREALFDLLQVEGLMAHTFGSAASFLAHETQDFDCVITDVRMPEIDGLELQRRLRALGSAMAVIFISASTNETTRERAMQGGATAWFTKPMADEELLHELQAVLDRRKIAARKD